MGNVDWKNFDSVRAYVERLGSWQDKIIYWDGEQYAIADASKKDEILKLGRNRMVATITGTHGNGDI